MLNILAGRLTPEDGEIRLNGTKISKKLKKKICYVLQEDIFFANLTFRETLTVSMLQITERESFHRQISFGGLSIYMHFTLYGQYVYLTNKEAVYILHCVKHDKQLKTRGKCRKHELQASVFYIANASACSQMNKVFYNKYW